MATVMMTPFVVRRAKAEKSAPKTDRRVISIEDYRGVVLLPVRNRETLPNVIPMNSWNSGPLSVA